MENYKLCESEMSGIEISTYRKDTIIELISLEGNISKKAFFNHKNEIPDLFGSCCGVFFYRISKGSDVWKSGRIVLK